MVLTADDVWPHWPAMLAASRKVLRDREEAHDCAAEAVVQALLSPRRGVRNPEAYLVTIAKRRAIDRYRELAADRRRQERLIANSRLAVSDVSEVVVDRAEAHWVAERAREVLSPHAYQLLCLIAEGESIEVAARSLDLSQRAAESLLLRSRRVMRSALAKTLALLGLAGGLIKRGSAQAPAILTAAVVTVFCLLVPSQQNIPPVENSPQTNPSVTVQDELHTTAQDRSTGRASRSALSGLTSPLPAAPTAVPTPQVRTPLGGVGSYDKDDGYEPSGPVDLLMHCLQNLRIELHHQGCDQPSPSPSP